ncbi:conserved membrane hypothetical protein [Micromonospora lupini str. Lupac 08]|uniref:Uncharacterized protein n=1 Tax=Micromonospora lupini str. Lupac 08 TaxID=1150864 RepID=I0LDD1_9ACTN|nr:conserved membrane hypothetical protein [Micromonospora lupini str. Lupac 08]
MTSPGSMPAPATGPTGPATGPVGPQPTPPGQTGQPTPPGQPRSGPGATPPPVAGRPHPWPPQPWPSQSVPPRPPSLLAQRWPGPTGTARPLLLGVLTAAAVVGASALTVVRPGLGWLVAALAATAALATAALATAGFVRSGTPSPAQVTERAAPAAPGSPPAPGSSPAPSLASSGPTSAATPSATEKATLAPATTAVPQASPPTAAPAAPSGPDTTVTPATAPPPAATSAAQPPTAQPAATAAPTPTAPPTPTAVPASSAAATTVRPGATGAPGRAAQVVWAAATVALVAVGTVRAAGWLFVLCLLAAAVTATLAVTGGRTPLGMLLAATLPPAATVRALPWAVRGLHGTRSSGPGIGRIVTSLAISVGLLTLFGLLFSSADAVFADLLAGLLPDISPGGVVGWLLRLGLIGLALLGGAYLVSRPPDLDSLRAKPGRPVHRLEWALPLVLLDALFAAFVLVQLTVFFGGAGHVLRTAGLTYAEYARSGFWQLLAVTALTLLVIAVAARRAPKATRADRLLVRALLGALTALSLVVVASSLYRMQVYADAYGATRLRLFVATVELSLGLLFVLVGVAVALLRAKWLPRLVIGTAVLALLGLAVVNPDRLIADRNVDRYLDTGRLDITYLSGLSADAVPALDRLPEPMRTCALREIAFELPEDGLWATNLGRERARSVLDATGVTSSTTDCVTQVRW